MTAPTASNEGFTIPSSPAARRYRAGQGSNEMYCTGHELSAGTARPLYIDFTYSLHFLYGFPDGETV